MKIVLIYLLIVNIIAFALFGIDKRKAQLHAWRIPERTLFGAALIGGSVGSILGMRIFHHKTRHWYFKYGLPAILLLQVAAAVVIAMKIKGILPL